jgi:LysR family glycine cleavage system transcriptional activator
MRGRISLATLSRLPHKGSSKPGVAPGWRKTVCHVSPSDFEVPASNDIGLRPIIAGFDTVISQYTNTQLQRSLRISVQPFFASEMFVPRLPEFVAQHPDIDIRIDTSDESLEKHPGTADVSIRILKTPPKALAYDALFRLRLIPAGTLDLYDTIRVKAGRIVGPCPLVVHESRPRGWLEWERSSRLKFPDHPNAVRLDSMIAVARAAERGLGAALIPKQLGDSWFESTSLVQLFEHELLTRSTYYLVYRQEDRANEVIQAFREWVLENFANDG